MAAMTEASTVVPDRLRRIRDRHFDCYAELADIAKNANRDEADWFEVIDSEIANIRSALEWGLATERPDTAAFAASLYWYWRRSRRFTEGRQVLDRGLRHLDLPQTDRLDALLSGGWLAWDQGDLAAAAGYHESARRLAAAVGDPRRQARAAKSLGWSLYHLVHAASAVEAFTEALALGDHLSLAERAEALRGLGWASLSDAGWTRAVELHREAGELLEDAGDADLPLHYAVETQLLVQAGRPQEALVIVEKLLALALRGAGHLGRALEAKAKVAQALGDRDLLRRVLYQGADAARAEQSAVFEASFLERWAEDAAVHGDVGAARDAADRAVRLLDAVDTPNADELHARARLLLIRAHLAEDDGELPVAEELYQQAVGLYCGMAARQHAHALTTLSRFFAAHGDIGAARVAAGRAVVVAEASDPGLASYVRINLALVEGDIEAALGHTATAVEAARSPDGQAQLLRMRAETLAESGRLNEARAALEEAVATLADSLVTVDAGLRVDRARVRIAAGEAEGARSDLLASAPAAQVGWASDQLHVATTLARLALWEGREADAVSLWSAVQSYRAANRRIAPRLSRRFEEPLRELELDPTAKGGLGNSRHALNALRSLVVEAFSELR